MIDRMIANMSDEDLFQAALADRDSGRSDLAIRKFKELSRRLKGSAAVRIVLADVQWNEGYLDKAFRTFAEAAKLKPDSKMASLGLFHVALELGKVEFAIREGDRFLALRLPCGDYRKIVKAVTVLYETLGSRSKRVIASIANVNPTGLPNRRSLSVLRRKTEK